MKKTIKNLIIPVIQFLAKCLTLIVPIKKGLVLCWSFEGKQYGGNPRCISEYIQMRSNDFHIIWLYTKQSKSSFPANVRKIRFGSLKNYYLMNVAEFLITDSRDFRHFVWHKRKGQKYIMTWHGGIGIKKIEGDAINTLPEEYIKLSKLDSAYADLFLSGSDFLTSQYRRAFWYNGEVLQKGMPSYDIFFDRDKVLNYNKKIRSHLSLPDNSFVILYAPTFRSDHSIEPYRVDWNNIISVISAQKCTEVFVLIKLHPGLLSENIDINSLLLNKNVIDVTEMGDIIPLMCASDILISDYSSTPFEMALLGKPSFIYAPDYDEYDRGLYISLKSLPFMFSSNQVELVNNIIKFNYDIYKERVKKFYSDYFGVCDNGTACESVYNWMLSKKLQS